MDPYRSGIRWVEQSGKTKDKFLNGFIGGLWWFRDGKGVGVEMEECVNGVGVNEALKLMK